MVRLGVARCFSVRRVQFRNTCAMLFSVAYHRCVYVWWLPTKKLTSTHMRPRCDGIQNTYRKDKNNKCPKLTRADEENELSGIVIKKMKSIYIYVYRLEYANHSHIANSRTYFYYTHRASKCVQHFFCFFIVSLMRPLISHVKLIYSIRSCTASVCSNDSVIIFFVCRFVVLFSVVFSCRLLFQMHNFMNTILFY